MTNGSSKAALIVVDMLNTYEHPDGDRLKESARDVVPVIAEMIDGARRADAPVVYVNDNHGDWTAGRSKLTEWALGGDPSLIEPIKPPSEVPFLVKARHSVFYSTQLEYLLREQEVTELVLVGQVTEQCILYSALDAYIRHFEVTVPRDAVAHIHEDLAEAALRLMETNMSATILDSGRAPELLAP
jgi:nicotinamidase-related amidase